MKTPRIWAAVALAGVLLAGCRALAGHPVGETPKTGTTTAATVPGVETLPEGPVLLEVPYVSQEGYPTGCESATAVMLLQAQGAQMDMDTFIDEYLDCGEFRWESDGWTAPHPAEQFVGDPRSRAAYGCFAPVILRALERCCPEGLEPVDETGSSLPGLCRRYLDRGQPVAVWATIHMKPVCDGTTWRVETTGESFTWPAGEHCLLLVGYNEQLQMYYFQDPYEGRGLVSWPYAIAEARFEELGRQAVALRQT